MTAFEDGDLNAKQEDEYEDLDASAVAHLNGEEPAQEQDTDDEYSDKVRKRIGKEVSKRKRIEGERDVYKEAATKAASELAEFKKAEAERRKARLEAETSALAEQAASRLEDGETADYMKLNDQLLDRKIELRDVSRDIAAAASVPEAPTPKVSDAAIDWMSENEDWLKTDHEKAKQAKSIEDELKAEGYSVSDPGTYQELSRRLNTLAKERNPPSTPQVSVPGSSIPSSPASNARRLNNEDLQTMQRYGLDPRNPAHRAEWLSSKGGA